MSTSDPLPVETITEIALLKEKMVEMMHIMWQLTRGTRNNTSGPSSSNPEVQATLSFPNNEIVSPNPNTDQTMPSTGP